MSDIGPGDVVVCVDASRALKGRGTPPTEWLVKGAVYRVARLVNTPEGHGIWVRPDEFRHPNAAWCPSRFRKIDPADDSFTRTVRACKPIRQREDA